MKSGFFAAVAARSLLLAAPASAQGVKIGVLNQPGGDTWFFLTADYAFGYALEKDVTHAGGKVIGSVCAPLNSSDFSSFLLQAQSSKAKVVGLANAGQIDLPVCERNMLGK